MNESYFLHNKACPKCTSRGKDRHRDNLAVFSDGRHRCWSCGYFRLPDSLARLGVHKPVKRLNHKIVLPNDADTLDSYTALSWLAQYDITRSDALKHGFLWSEEGVTINLKGEKTQCRDVLIIPFWANGDLLGYLCRYFGGNPDIPKWITRGRMQEIYHILPGKKPIVLTEDIISAIKVNKVVGHASMPVLGIFAKGRYRHLKLLGHTEAYLWLDPDMHVKSIEQSRLGSLYGINVKSILSRYDPKCLEYNEIKELLDAKM